MTFHNKRCPKCGARVHTDGLVVVCSLESGCSYGIAETVTVEEHEKPDSATRLMAVFSGKLHGGSSGTHLSGSGN